MPKSLAQKWAAKLLFKQLRGTLVLTQLEIGLCKVIANLKGRYCGDPWRGTFTAHKPGISTSINGMV